MKKPPFHIRFAVWDISPSFLLPWLKRVLGWPLNLVCNFTGSAPGYLLHRRCLLFLCLYFGTWETIFRKLRIGPQRLQVRQAVVPARPGPFEGGPLTVLKLHLDIQGTGNPNSLSFVKTQWR
eukprot:symbB.v1.2.025928.t1/scaffold2553.1/size78617/2